MNKQTLINALKLLEKKLVSALKWYDEFLEGHKTFISLIVVLIALYVMPEGKGTAIVGTIGVLAVGSPSLY